MPARSPNALSSGSKRLTLKTSQNREDSSELRSSSSPSGSPSSLSRPASAVSPSAASRCTAKSDMWSLGVMILEAHFGPLSETWVESPVSSSSSMHPFSFLFPCLPRFSCTIVCLLVCMHAYTSIPHMCVCLLCVCVCVYFHVHICVCDLVYSFSGVGPLWGIVCLSQEAVSCQGRGSPANDIFFPLGGFECVYQSLHSREGGKSTRAWCIFFSRLLGREWLWLWISFRPNSYQCLCDWLLLHALLFCRGSLSPSLGGCRLCFS